MREALTFWHERRLWRVDARLTSAQAKAFIDGKAPDIGFPMKGQDPDPEMWQVGDEVEIDPHRLSFAVVKLKAKAGRWEVQYLLRDHRPNLLARRTGYTHDPKKALGATERHLPGNLRDEPEGVGNDWQDMGVAARKIRAQNAASEERAEEKAREEARKLKARVDQVVIPTGKRGVDLTPELADIYARLAALEKKAA